MQHIEACVREHPRRVLLVYRKMPSTVGDYPHASPTPTPELRR